MTDILQRLVLRKLAARTIFDTRLIIIYALNVSDYILTLILLQSGMFTEVNPVLSAAIGNFGGFVLKCLVPLVLLLCLRSRLRNAAEKQIKAIKYILNAAVTAYAVINIFHICWLIILGFYFVPLSEQFSAALSAQA